MLFSGSTAEDCYTIVFVLACPEKGHSFSFSAEYTDGYVGFYPPGSTIDVATPACYSNASLTIPSAKFHDALALHFPDMPEQILAQGAGMRVGIAEQTMLRGLVTALEETVANDAQPLMEVSARKQVESELLGAFFAALRSGCEQLVPPPSSRMAGRLRHFRQAREFLAEHLQEPLYVESLSRATNLSVRGVEQLFSDYLGVSPVSYLRKQRLHNVRRILKTTKPSFGLIKDTALQWGFWHLGHFARDYRTLFGESPRDTAGLPPEVAGDEDRTGL